LRVSRMALLMAAMVGAASEALAQQPSQAQLNAIRQSCRSDYGSLFKRSDRRRTGAELLETKSLQSLVPLSASGKCDHVGRGLSCGTGRTAGC
jgi:hypothetical protein